jgi:phage-related protein
VIETDLGILVFHGFKKKTQQTPQTEIDTGKKRLKAFLEELKDET